MLCGATVLLLQVFIGPGEVVPTAEVPSDPPPPPPEELLTPRLVRSLTGESDPITDVFRVVEALWNVRPAQAVNASEQFLWRAIYPQDEDGRPVYNVCGECPSATTDQSVFALLLVSPTPCDAALGRAVPRQAVLRW